MAGLLAGCAGTSSSTAPAGRPVAASAATAVTATSGASSSAAPHRAAVPGCTRPALALSGPLEGFGGATGEHELTFALRNVSPRACSLEGYPTVRLYDPSPMAFVYDNARLVGLYLSTAPPSAVVVPAHGQAYVQVVKFRCDLGEGPFATRIRITLPGQPGAFDALPGPPVDSARSLAMCTGQPDDPGNVVSVSPVRGSAAAFAP